MKRLIVAGACLLLAAFLILPTASSQERNAPSGSSDAGRGTGADASAAAAAAGAAASSGNYSSSTTSSTSYGHSSTWVTTIDGFGRSSPGYSSGSYSTVSAPRISIEGTSFSTKSIYRHWNQYYGQISNYSWDGCTAYMQGYGYWDTNAQPYCSLSPYYFSRFYKNVEPLMTPTLLRLTLRQPLLISQNMLQAIDQLEIMLADARAGKPVDKLAIAAKSREIREYAKQIRQDRTLSVYDIRRETDVVGDTRVEALSPESIAKLRELALDIHLQLQNLSSLSSSSTMSVDSYQEPSFESITKGIEKVCKAIENSSKRL